MLPRKFCDFCYHLFQLFIVILDTAELLILQFVFFSLFCRANVRFCLKIKRRGQSFADKKRDKSVQINLSSEILTIKR